MRKKIEINSLYIPYMKIPILSRTSAQTTTMEFEHVIEKMRISHCCASHPGTKHHASVFPHGGDGWFEKGGLWNQRSSS